MTPAETALAECAYPGCDRPPNGWRGWCRACYQRWIRAGRPDTGPPPPRKAAGRRRIDCPICGATGRLNAGWGWCKSCYVRWVKAGRPDGGPPPPGRALQPCGTYAAWQRHYKAGEKPCEACMQAKNAYIAAESRKARSRDAGLPPCTGCGEPRKARQGANGLCQRCYRKRRPARPAKPAEPARNGRSAEPPTWRPMPLATPAAAGQATQQAAPIGDRRLTPAQARKQEKVTRAREARKVTRLVAKHARDRRDRDELLEALGLLDPPPAKPKPEPEPVIEKICSHCGQTKPAGEFYRQAKTRDGLMARCKPCHNTGSNAARTAVRGRRRADHKETA